MILSLRGELHLNFNDILRVLKNEWRKKIIFETQKQQLIRTQEHPMFCIACFGVLLLIFNIIFFSSHAILKIIKKFTKHYVTFMDKPMMEFAIAWNEIIP